MTNIEDNVDWQKINNLLPAIVQDTHGQVLMLGYMDAQALSKTLLTGLVTFYSRTKKRLWTKGETSGNILILQSITLDCDNDTALIRAIPNGPTCHSGSTSCFQDSEEPFNLEALEKVIDSRFKAQPVDSYISHLIGKGVQKMAQKVGEEGVEVALAAIDPKIGPFKEEVADLFFHALVLMRQRQVKLCDVIKILECRNS